MWYHPWWCVCIILALFCLNCGATALGGDDGIRCGCRSWCVSSATVGTGLYFVATFIFHINIGCLCTFCLLHFFWVTFLSAHCEKLLLTGETLSSARLQPLPTVANRTTGDGFFRACTNSLSTVVVFSEDNLYGIFKS